MKKHLSVLLVFLLFGCASTQNQSHFADNIFSCEDPKLTIRILKKVVKHKEGAKQGSGYTKTSHSYMIESGEFVGISIWRYRHTSSAEWRAADEQIVMNIGMVPLDPVRINNQTWISFVDLKNKKYIALGYFKRIDSNLVAVYSICKAEQFKGELAKLKNTPFLDVYQKQVLASAFNSNANLFVIE